MLDGVRKKLMGRYSVEWGQGHKRPGPPSPVEATFRHVLNQLTGVGMLASCDEETITAALLGGFSAAFPLCIGIFSADGSPNGKTEASNACAWGQYSKSRTGVARENEADRGADFALVMATGPDHARVALFQAKRVVAGKPNSATRRKMIRPEPYERRVDEASVGSTVIVPKDSYTIDLDQGRGERLAQFAVLQRTGSRLVRAQELEEDKVPTKLAEFLELVALADRGPFIPPRKPVGEAGDVFETRRKAEQKEYDDDTESARKAIDVDEIESTGADSTTSIKRLHFVHYLAYLRSKPVAPVEAASGTAQSASKALGTNDTDTEDSVSNNRFTGAVCVTLSQLNDFVVTPATVDKNTRLDLADVECIPFDDVILEAFGPPGFAEGWITLSTSTIRELLPTLLNFGRVFVGTDKGGDGLLLVREADAHLGIDSDAAGTVANAVMSGVHQATGGNAPTI